MVDARAVLRCIRAVVDIVIIRLIHQPDGRDPVPCLGRPRAVCGVSRVAGEPGAELEEPPVGDGVLVVLPVDVGREDLPVQPAGAARRVPARRHIVEDVGHDGRPAGEGGRGVREAVFGGGHGVDAPEGLVVVAGVEDLVLHHEVVVGPELGGEGGHGLVHVGRVALCQILLGTLLVCGLLQCLDPTYSVLPVVEHSSPHRTGFPPVVGRVYEQADLTCVTACIIGVV